MRHISILLAFVFLVTNAFASYPGETPSYTTIKGGNLKLDTNTLSSENTNGNILIDPNGTGTVQINSSFKSISTTKGSQPCPVMTEAQRDAIVSPENGDCVYNSDTDTLDIYDSGGASWNSSGPFVGTVNVSQGGTGQTSLTANNVILGNGTSAVQFVAPGTSGNFLKSNGTTWQSAAIGAGEINGTMIANEAINNARVSDGAAIAMSKTTYSVAYIKDVKSNGTTGGSSAAAGEQTRTLNTLEDADSIVTSLSSNQFTLPAGTYNIKVKVPAYRVNRHQAYLYNVTDSTIAIYGTVAYSASGADYATNHSFIEGKLVLASAKTYKINQYTGATNASGLGLEGGISSHSEIYTVVEIHRIK